MRPCEFGDWDALYAMHARFVLETRVGALALHLEDDFLVPADAGLVLGKHFGLPAVLLGVARVHAEQIGRKEGRLVAARAGADLDDDILFVARVARQEHGPQLLLKRRPLWLELEGLGLGQGAQVGVGLAAHGLGLFEGAAHPLELAIRGHQGFDLRAFAGQLRDARVVCGAFGHQAVEFIVVGGEAGELFQHLFEVS